jgi:phosphatidylserine/phosphatidylglycerophosphate/cardiolipin synthase-like enzyme
LAETYIYIEDQYLWDGALAEYIAKRMKENEKLHLIIVLGVRSDMQTPGLKAYHQYLRSCFFRKVMGLEPEAEILFGGRVRVYGLFQKIPDRHSHDYIHSVYVHSKLIIIDDRYVAIGSANVNERSMYIDTELTLGIIDRETVKSTLNGQEAIVCKFAKDLRENLWKEHLGLPALYAGDPLRVLNRDFPPYHQPSSSSSDYFEMSPVWPKNNTDAKRLQRHHLRCYIQEKHPLKRNSVVSSAVQRIVDRKTRKVWER